MLIGVVVGLRESRDILTIVMLTLNGWDRYGFGVERFWNVTVDKKPESIFSDFVGAIFGGFSSGLDSGLTITHPVQL